MTRKKWWWTSLSLAVVVTGIVGATALIAAGPKQDQGYQTPADIGAYFVPNYGLVKPSEFEPSLAQEKAEGIALEHLMDGFNIPKGRNLEDLMVVKSTPGIFSGAQGGFGDWNIHDKEVWIVVIDDLPFSLPCGPHGLADCPFHPPRMSVAVDAETAEVISGELTGAGRRSDKWRNRNLGSPYNDPNGPTPTPVPDKDDYCKRFPHNPNPVDPPPGGPTPTPVSDRDKACQ